MRLELRQNIVPQQQYLQILSPVEVPRIHPVNLVVPQIQMQQTPASSKSIDGHSLESIARHRQSLELLAKHGETLVGQLSYRVARQIEIGQPSERAHARGQGIELVALEVQVLQAVLEAPEGALVDRPDAVRGEVNPADRGVGEGVTGQVVEAIACRWGMGLFVS